MSPSVSPIRCPRCDIEMKVQQGSRKGVSRCSKCRGVWFPGTLLEQRFVERGILFEISTWQKLESEPAPPCPECRGHLALLIRGDLEIDRCASCNGVYLDAGELGRLAAARGAREHGAAPATSGQGPVWAALVPEPLFEVFWYLLEG